MIKSLNRYTLAFLLFVPIIAFAAPTLPDYAVQIKGCTAADGAIFMEPEKNKVEVYFGCTAARGLLTLYSGTGDTSYRNAAVRWVDWLVAHQEPEGYWFDYDNGGTTQVTPDSWDSYASLFLTVVHETRLAAGEGAFLTVERQSAMQKAFTCIRNLVQANGLTIAMPSYPAQYTMDNAEVYEGLKAAASDWQLLGVDSLSHKADSLAQVIQANIRSRLWDSESRLYKVAIGEPAPDLTVWYPDIMAQLLPLRFGVETADAASSTHILDTLKPLPLWNYPAFNASYAIPQGIPADDVLHMAHFAKCMGYSAAMSDIARGVDSVALQWPVDLYAGWRLVIGDASETPVSMLRMVQENLPSVFPNPFSASCFPAIRSAVPIEALSLFDMQGRLIQKFTPNRNNVFLNLEEPLSCGYYLLHYRTCEGQQGNIRLIRR